MKGFQNSNNNKKTKNKNATFEENKNLYNKAFNLQNKGDYIQAAKTYNDLFKKNFRTEEFFLNYAKVSQYLNNTNGAIVLSKEAININSKNFIPFFKRSIKIYV